MWTGEEHKKFEDALNLFGKKDIKKISEYIGTRSHIQVRSHMQKYFKKLEKQKEKEQKLSSEDQFIFD